MLQSGIVLLLAAVGFTAGSSNDLTNFLLVTSSSWEQSSNSSTIANVSATSLYDPYGSTTFQLRLIGPGYGSLPTFNLSDASLTTAASGPHGVGEYQYWSASVVEDEALNLVPNTTLAGHDLSLEKGYLLAVDGEIDGWSVCEDEIEEEVLFWKGNGTGCAKVFVQAVNKAPY